MNLKPLLDRVVVKPAKAEDQTKSGLFIPDTAKEKPHKGEIVAVGEGRWDEEGKKRVPLDVKVGDTVMYEQWGATEIKIDGEEYQVMSSDKILGIIQ